jgi:Jacalin-like lectin domain
MAQEEPKVQGKKGTKSTDNINKSTVLYKGYRKEERGSNKYGNDFNDREFIQEKKTKIVKVTVWFNTSKILGLQAHYKPTTGDIIKGGEHFVKQDGASDETFAMEGDDFLKEISGFMDKKEESIECLILTSFKGEVHKFGKPSGSGKNFKLGVNELEYPACFFGTIRGKMIEINDILEGKENWLSRIGVLIASEELD